MNRIDLKIAHSDSRGSIQDLLSGIDINAVTIVTFTAGAVRGNHYHQKTIQWNYCLEGEIRYVTQQENGSIKECILRPGDFVETKQNEAHALQGMTEAKLLVLTKGPRAGEAYEDDTYRLSEKLL
jgi:oxalate decarboxylase/phosphoglucose isomerase-like protein (cupin superfamily)